MTHSALKHLQVVGTFLLRSVATTLTLNPSSLGSWYIETRTKWRVLCRWIFIWIFIQFSLKFASGNPIIDDKPALVRVNAWCLTYSKPLPEPLMTQFIDAYIDGLMQERCNSSALAMELRLSCINPLICGTGFHVANVGSSHYLNQILDYQVIVDWKLGNKLQWNFFIQIQNIYFNEI